MSTTFAMDAIFNPGNICVTRDFARKCNPEYAMACLAQHLMGNWGLLDEEDTKRNNNSLKKGGRLISVYPLPNDPDNFWIITEADHSQTTFLLPEEY